MDMLSLPRYRCYDAPPLRMDEVLRYAGARGQDGQLCALVLDCHDRLKEGLSYRVCSAVCPILRDGDRICVGAVETTSLSLAKSLEGCDQAVVFAATVGIQIDRQIARYARLEPSRALIIQAIGSERVEALCDAFCADVDGLARANGRSVRGRFSPGYGDLPLSLQPKLLQMLDAERSIGVTLSESLLMTPSKSVTAIIGITEKKPNGKDAL